METQSKKITQTEIAFLPLGGSDYVEFYPGNASRQRITMSAFGFQSLAYAGTETGRSYKASYVVIKMIKAIHKVETKPEGTKQKQSATL